MRSFKFAFEGIITLIRSQRNAKIHFALTVLALILAWRFKINSSEWMGVLFSIGIVWLAEAFNTAIELICDLVHPDEHPKIKFVKDVAAGGVLISAIVAMIVGLIIFLPKVIELWNGAV